MAQPQNSHLTSRDEAIIALVPEALRRGLSLLNWWKRTQGRDTERFELVRTFNRPDMGFSFFARPPLDGKPFPAMGDFQDLFYDRPKVPSANPKATQWIDRQVREFVFHYLLRILSTRSPAPIPQNSSSPPQCLKALSWCPDRSEQLNGFGYSQLYYKRRKTGEVGKFPPHERRRIIDLRRLVDEFEWVVLSIRIFDFDLEFQPFGNRFPNIDIPLREKQLAVISRDFLVNRQQPQAEIFGEYGLGYALIPHPEPDTSALAYGPGHFTAGFQLIHYRVLDSGEVRILLNFLVNQPKRLFGPSLDPLTWLVAAGDQVQRRLPSGRRRAEVYRLRPDLPPFSPLLTAIEALNLFTGGLAGRYLCISKRHLLQEMLVKHFIQNLNTFECSLFTWRQIPNWLDAEALPAWLVGGLSPGRNGP